MERKRFENIKFEKEETREYRRKFVVATILGCVTRIIIKWVLMICFMAAFDNLGYFEYGFAVKAASYIVSIWLSRVVFRDIYFMVNKERYGGDTVIDEFYRIFEEFK